MSPKLLLRLASVTLFLHYIGHFMAIPNSKMPNDKIPDTLVKQMSDLKIDYLGKSGNFMLFYESNIYAMSMALMLVVVLLWFLSDLSVKIETALVRILIPIIFFLILLGGEEMLYYYPVTGALSLISAVSAGIAYFKMKGLTIKISMNHD